MKQATSIDYFHSSKKQEWYTPARYIEAARLVMGGIDLDPASCEVANSWIKAEKYYSLAEKGENALALPWSGRIWLNPPFNQSEKFRKKLIQEYEAGRLTQAIALFKFVPSYNWFQPLTAYPMIVTDHRVSFWVEYKKTGESNMDNAICFIYLGPKSNQRKFESAFSAFGHSLTFRSSAAPAEDRTGVCEICGNMFAPKEWGGSTKEYCRPACKQKAYRLRRSNERNTERNTFKEPSRTK